MNYSEYLALVEKCKNYNTAEEARPELAKTLVCEFSDLNKAIDIIFAVSKFDVVKLVEISRLKKTAFGRYFNVPFRSLQNWVLGTRAPADYVPQLIGFAMLSDCEKLKTAQI